MRTSVPLAVAMVAALALSACKKEEEAAAPPRPVLSLVVTPVALPGTRFAGTVQAKVQAAESERQVQEQVETARREAQQLITQAQEISTRIQTDARTQAQADAEATLARARSEIQQERDQAIADLRKEFADMTISAAEKVINQSLDRNAHRRLIEEALEGSSFGGGRN